MVTWPHLIAKETGKCLGARGKGSYLKREILLLKKKKVVDIRRQTA